VVAVLFLFSRPAAGAEVDLHMTLMGQGYQTRTADGDLIDRRRLIQWVDLRAQRLWGQDGLSLASSFRLQFDMGQGDELNIFGDEMAELMLFQLRWHRRASRLAVSFGRILHFDELDFLAYDGLRVDYQFPHNFSLQLLAGFCQRDRAYLAGELLQLDGEDERTEPAPMVGASFLFQGPILWAGLSYRRVVLWAEDWPLEEELAGAWASARLWQRRLGLDLGAVFDLGKDQWDRLRAETWLRLFGPLGHVRLESGFLRSRPRFAMSSIFHFFQAQPFDEVRTGLRWQPRNALFAAPLSLRLVFTNRRYGSAEESGDDAGQMANGLDFEGRFPWGRRASASLNMGYEDGSGGRRWLLAARLRTGLPLPSLWLDTRAVLHSFVDPVQERQQALSVGGSASLSWRFAPSKALVAMAHLNGNRFHPFQLRLLLVLDLAFQFGGSGVFP